MWWEYRWRVKSFHDIFSLDSCDNSYIWACPLNIQKSLSARTKHGKQNDSHTASLFWFDIRVDSIFQTDAKWTAILVTNRVITSINGRKYMDISRWLNGNNGAPTSNMLALRAHLLCPKNCPKTAPFPERLWWTIRQRISPNCEVCFIRWTERSGKPRRNAAEKGLRSSFPDALNVLKICLYLYNIHPGKPTWYLKIISWKRRFLLDTIIF